jgi:AcrR family transcriptional regulator
VQEKIILKSIELFLEHGIKTVTMDVIAKKLGISKKTLYQYFDNKNALVMGVVDFHFQEEKKVLYQIIEDDQMNSLEKMIQIIKHITTVFSNLKPIFIQDIQKYYPKVWRQVETFQEEHILFTIEKNIKEGMSTKWFRAELNPIFIARLYLAKSFELIRLITKNQTTSTFTNLFKEMISYHLFGIIHQDKINQLEKKLSEL